MRETDSERTNGAIPKVITRRTVLQMAAGAVLATGAAPASGGPIVTDQTGIVAGDLTFPGPGGVPTPAYRAKPAGPGAPLLTVLHDADGLNGYVRDVCRRFAKAGYHAVAPDLFARYGQPSAYASQEEFARAVLARIPDPMTAGPLQLAREWAFKEEGATIERCFVAGFGWGGRIAWLESMRNALLKAAVAWYGPVTGPSSALQPMQPLQVARTVLIPVLGLYGGRDDRIPLASLEQMRASLAAGSSRSEIHVYPDVGNGFHADDRATYHEATARDAWRRGLEWYARFGGVPVRG